MAAKIVDKQEKKDQIIQAAITVFIQKGFARATINDIASQAGIGKGTVYEYFKTKDEIVNDSFYYFMRQLEADYENILITDVPGSEKLKKILAGFAGICESEYASIVELMFEFWSEGIRSKYSKGILLKEMNKFYGAYRNLISDVILEGMGDGSFKRNINPMAVATNIIGCLDGLILQWVLDHTAIDYKECVNALTNLILHGIQSE